MRSSTWSEKLWGTNSRVSWLLIASAILLLAMLGSREIWTQEHRWADIVYGMFYRHDFLHPYLNEVDYYDKPLLSYWLMAGFSFFTGLFSTWALRMPSALAGILAIWSIYRIGTVVGNKRLGLLSGWILLTTFYFIFWAKTSSADMLNLGGTLFAVSWYFDKRDQPGFFNYAIFFLILAVTGLCKGLIGVVVPLIVIFPDLLQEKRWKNNLRVSFLLAMVPALIVYVLPFWASAHFGGKQYGESGLMLVYQENIVRYFKPFDHKGPIYTYLIYLPLYLMPWAIFFIPALWTLPARWKSLSADTKTICKSVLLLFIFLTLSGSRRNYYVLPLVPFAILMTADWILARGNQVSVWAGRLAVSFFVLMFLNFDVVQPLYYAGGGQQDFAALLNKNLNRPKSDWQFVMLAPESKTRFYLQLPPFVKDYDLTQTQRTHLSPENLLQAWPVVSQKQPGVIFITRKSYVPLLKHLLPNYAIVEARENYGERILHQGNPNAPVAFIPPA
jgi:4-amino-4-deoxy-L-arabinose transferase-like glycosyltransferase